MVKYTETPGNHDITLDQDFYREHGLYFHNQNPQSPADCLSLLTSSPSITYLNHKSAHIQLRSLSGPRTHFNVFGSPYSPRQGTWAFAYDAPRQYTNQSDLPRLWEQIPLETDIVITHTPSRNHRDETDERRARGCEALRQALWRVRPRLAVCGHIHDGRGAERVLWDLDSQNVSYAEKDVTYWEDPGQNNDRISLVDLTGRKAPSLANDGAHPEPRSKEAQAPDVVDARTPDLSSVAGLGGDPTSARSDCKALAGKMSRRETCMINAAIMKSRYPHVGGKVFNKPIVVDVDLPVWEAESTR